MKKVIISLIILFLIASGFLTYKFIFMRDKNEKEPVVETTVIESKVDSKEMEEEENEPITETIEDDNDIVKNGSTNDNNLSSSNMESNNVRNSNVIKENTTTNNVKKEEPKQEEIQVQDTSTVITQSKEQTPWEKLGLTEDQYKNKPIYSWEEVEFSTREECAIYGDTNPPYSTGEGSYDCNEVSSWTRSLGWDFVPHYR